MNYFDMELTQRQAKEYSRLTKSKKGEIISQYCKLTKVSRNLASKRFSKVMRNIHPRVLKKVSKKRGRKPKYTMHKKVIRKAWELSGEICGERLHPVLWVNHETEENNYDLTRASEIAVWRNLIYDLIRKKI